MRPARLRIDRRPVPLLAAAAIALCALAGCGHSEDEWQAMLKTQTALRDKCLEQRALASPGLAATGGGEPDSCDRDPTCRMKRQALFVGLPLGTTGGCGKDTDCKGDRICRLGQCAAPEAREVRGGP